ncbi:unnamed protein product [Rotaria socialis]|uniref:Uncharacterized protein n=2 Tax=Rotaria socialis TaxID=392032 RepID=A0A818WD70_9BILA|nr:unnamed protein product [Rotaria socialis]
MFIIFIFMINKEIIIKLTIEILQKKMGSERIIQFDEQLYKQIILDLIKIYSKEYDQAGQGKQAKELLESVVKLINTIDDKDEELQQMKKYLLSRISYLK